MKAFEIRNLSDDEIKTKMEEVYEELFNLRFQLAIGKVKDPSRIRLLKRDVARMKSTYDERRRYMIRRLKELGFRIAVEPTGAFYIFVNARHLSPDSYALAFDILEKAHVGVTPGIDFGKNGEGFLRFSYANSLANIKEGLNRLENYINNHASSN